MYIHIHSRYCTLINYIAEHMHWNVSLYVWGYLSECSYTNCLNGYISYCVHFSAFICVCVCARKTDYKRVQICSVKCKSGLQLQMSSCWRSVFAVILRVVLTVKLLMYWDKSICVCVCVFRCQGRSILPITSGNCASARDFVTKVQLWCAWPMCNSFTVFVVVMQWNIKKNG